MTNMYESEEIDWDALFCREDVSENLIPFLPKVTRTHRQHA